MDALNLHRMENKTITGGIPREGLERVRRGGIKMGRIRNGDG